MASRPKSGRTGTRRTSSRSRKPATIDLEAKEVGSQGAKPKEPAAKETVASKAKSQDTKTAAAAKSPVLGRSGSAGKDAKAGQNSSDKASAKADDSAKAGGATERKADSTPKGTPEKAESEKSPAAMASVKDEKRGNPFVPAIVGALFAVLGLGAIGQFDGARNIPLIGNLYGTEADTNGSVTAQQFAALQEKVTALSANGDSEGQIDVAPINTKLADLENQLKALEEAGLNASGAADPALLTRIGSIETALEQIRQDLENSVSGNSGAAANEAVSALDTRLAKLETSVASLASADDKLAQLENQVTSLSAAVNEVRATGEKNATSLAELVSQSTELKNTVASVKTSEKVAKSVAVNALASALENDDPLGLPISSLEALVGEMPETQRLLELSQEGIPSIKELVSGIEVFANEVSDPASLSEDATLSDKFWANAQSLVTFRSTGPRDGNDPAAILSRVKAFVEAGNLSSAGTEWNTLPEALQEKGQGWRSKLAIRSEAQTLQQEISSKLALQAG